MNAIGLIMFAVGIVLLIFGFSQTHTATPDVSKVITDHASHRHIWFIAGGALSVISGMILALKGVRRD